MEKYVIAVTGHRDIVITETLKQELSRYFELLAQTHRRLILMTPLAQGADMLAAQIFLTLQAKYSQLEIIVPLPFALENYMQTYTEQEQVELKRLLKTASKVYIVPPLLQDVYSNLGAHLVTQANMLLALWDGTDNAKPGGTADVVRYAISQNLPVKHFWVERSLSPDKIQ